MSRHIAYQEFVYWILLDLDEESKRRLNLKDKPRNEK